jgi:hypothetical protein
MAKVYPSGKNQAFRIQDDLKGKDCNWYLDASQKTLQLFITAINEAMLNHRGDIAEAEKAGTGKFLEKECVRILLSPVTAGNADTVRQPQAVRARLKARCLMAGEPQDVQTLISRLIKEAKFIVDAVVEVGLCGLAYRPIAKKDPAKGTFAEAAARSSSTSSSSSSRAAAQDSSHTWCE